MKKRLIAFLRDQIPTASTYFIGIGVVVLFYSLQYRDLVEVIYPLSLAFVVYLVYCCYVFYRHYVFYRAIKAMTEFRDTGIFFHGGTEEAVQNAIGEIHRRYTKKICTLEHKTLEERRFISTWVHNMKTPVSVISLLMQRYHMGDISGESLVREMEQENIKLLAQLDVVLNIIRMQEFVKDYTPSSVNLTQSVQKIINKNRSSFIYNHVFPKFDAAEDFFVLSDSKWNDMVIEQLISNAVKYSAPSEKNQSKNIYFSIFREGNKTTLTIRDEGCGIPEYDMSRIFEPFFTGDNGRISGKSTGIGLYFCKEICNMLGHTLTITSKKGVSTTASITYLSKL
jgi:signal transduction histidine kinase